MSEKVITQQCHLYILSHMDQGDTEQMNCYIQNLCMSMKQRGFTNNEIYAASNLNNLVHTKYIGGTIGNADEYVSAVLSSDVSSCQEYYKKYDNSTAYCYACKYSNCYCNKNLINEKKILGYAFRNLSCAMKFNKLHLDTSIFKSVFVTDNHVIKNIYPVRLNQILAEFCVEYLKNAESPCIYNAITEQYSKECAEDIQKFLPSYIEEIIQLSKDISITNVRTLSTKLGGNVKPDSVVNGRKKGSSKSSTKTPDNELDMAKLLFGTEFSQAIEAGQGTEQDNVSENTSLIKSINVNTNTQLEQQYVGTETPQSVPDAVEQYIQDAELIDNTLASYGLQGFVRKVENENLECVGDSDKKAIIDPNIDNIKESDLEITGSTDIVSSPVSKQEMSSEIPFKNVYVDSKEKKGDSFFEPIHLLKQKDIDSNMRIIHGNSVSDRDLLENCILDEGCLILDIFFDEKTQPFFCIYLHSLHRFLAFSASDKQCINIFGSYVNRKRFKVICFSAFPLLAECSRVGLKPRNVYSVMTMYGIIRGNKDIKNADDIIHKTVQVDNIYNKSFILYAMPYYFKMYNVLENELNSSTEARVKMYAEAELAIGASYYLKNVVNTERPLLCINNCLEYHYNYTKNIMTYKMKGYYVTVSFYLDGNVLTNGLELIYTLIGHYSERGYFRKCPIHILKVSKNRFIYHVNDRMAYDYTFDMFCYLSELIAGRIFDSGCSIHFSYKMYK